MANLHEIINSLNDENVAEVKKQLKEAADVQHEGNKHLYSRTKKAEGFEQKDGKWVKKPEPKPVKKKEPEAKKSSEPDYSERIDKLFLKGEGIDHEDDIKFVMDTAKRLKLPVDEVIKDKYIKSKLNDSKTQREADAGTPNKKGKSGGASQSDVNYWVDKKDADGNYQNPDDLELFEKVHTARIKRDENAGQFEPIR